MILDSFYHDLIKVKKASVNDKATDKYKIDQDLNQSLFESSTIK